MLVSPVEPTSSSGSRRRLLQIAAPLAALVLTAGVGLSGRFVAPEDPRPSVDHAVQAPPDPVRQTAAPTPEPSPIGIPKTAYRLPVRTVPDIVGSLDSMESSNELVAVAGSFTLDPRLRDCERARSLSNSLCERTGFLAASIRPVMAAHPNGIDPEAIRLSVGFASVGVRVPIGVPVPTAVIWAAAVAGAIEPIPVVLVGRFDSSDERGCAVGFAPCVPALIVERVAWLAGEWSHDSVVRSPVVPAATMSERSRAARTISARETDRDEPILGRALLTPSDLRLVDPDAAGALAVAVEGPIWYVRSVARPAVAGGPRGVAWVAIDHRTGLVLAQGAVRPSG